MTPDFWTRLVETSDAIGARRPEDLLLVLLAETNFTLDPAVTKPFRPNIRPKNWTDLDAICKQEGTGQCGALGLNTIEPTIARALGLTASEWYGLADLTAIDGLYYVGLYFNAVRKNAGRTGYVNALELYLANAGANLLKYKIAPSTVVYDAAQTATNTALDFNKDGEVTVQDIGDTLVQIVWPRAMPFLNEYNQSQAARDRVARLYQGGALAPLYHPTGVGVQPGYAPTPTQTAIDQINADRPGAKREERNLGLTIAAASLLLGACSTLAFFILHHKTHAHEHASHDPADHQDVFENPIARFRAPPGGRVQSLLFRRDVFSTRTARQWARSHGYRTTKVDVTDDYVRLRQAPPGRFSRLRTVRFGHGVSGVVGWSR